MNIESWPGFWSLYAPRDTWVGGQNESIIWVSARASVWVSVYVCMCVLLLLFLKGNLGEKNPFNRCVWEVPDCIRLRDANMLTQMHLEGQMQRPPCVVRSRLEYTLAGSLAL
jgi:hypothetical protein